MREKKGTHNLNYDELPEVIDACMHNDPQAQRVIIRKYYGYVKSICLRYTSNDQDAEEILNDSFLKILSHLDQYDANQPFKSWVRKVAVNTAIDHYRRNLRKIETEGLGNIQAAEVEMSILDQISAEEILAMVRRLTPAYRMVFSLFVIDGYSHKEIAEKLGIREGTSKSNLQDARKKLQLMILEQNPDMYYAYEMKNTTSNEE